MPDSVGTRIRQACKTEPHKFQVQGVRFLEAREGRGILGDSMGLGKTFQALAWAAIHPENRPVVVVCPASVKIHWQRQLFFHARIQSQILSSYKPLFLSCRIWKKKVGEGKPRPTVQWYRTTAQRAAFIRKNSEKISDIKKGTNPKPRPEIRSPIIIINYEVLHDWAAQLIAIQPKLLIIDEFHRIKNRSANRTKICLGLGRKVPHIIALSGTPITNRPVEFFPILNLIDPETFNSFWEYAFRYCDPKQGWRGRGWDFTGASNLEELNDRVSRLMIRRLKSEVLKELPPKVRTTIPIEIDNRPEYDRAEQDFLRWLEKRAGKDASNRAAGAVSIVKMGALKRLAAEGKLKGAIRWIEDFLEDSGEKLVVFAIHRNVLEALHKKFPHSAQIHGGISSLRRQAEIDKFNRDRQCRLFLGQIKAAGEGVDGLQHASSSVMFLELGWTASEHEQAEDRALRIGQEADSVNVYYLLAPGTIDDKIQLLIESKFDVCNKVLDGGAREALKLLQTGRLS